MQARDRFHNNIDRTLSEAVGEDYLATLTYGTNVITGAITDYVTSDVSNFDTNTAQTGVGDLQRGIYVVEYFVPQGTPPGDYNFFVRLGAENMLFTSSNAVTISEVNTCVLSDEIILPQTLEISNSKDHFPTSVSYASEIAWAQSILNDYSGATEACGTLKASLYKAFPGLFLQAEEQMITLGDT